MDIIPTKAANHLPRHFLIVVVTDHCSMTMILFLIGGSGGGGSDGGGVDTDFSVPYPSQKRQEDT